MDARKQITWPVLSLCLAPVLGVIPPPALATPLPHATVLLANDGPEVDARTTLASLKASAAANHKNVLLIFSASWCGPCHLLEHFLADPAIRPIMQQQFEIATLDVGESSKDTRHHDTPGAAALRSSLAGSADPGYPYFVMIDPGGHRLADSVRPDSKQPAGENIGYPAIPVEIDWFMSMLHRSAPSLSPADTETIHAWLLRHQSH